MSDLLAQVNAIRPRDLAHLSVCCVLVCRLRGMNWTATRALSCELYQTLKGGIDGSQGTHARLSLVQ